MTLYKNEQTNMKPTFNSIYHQWIMLFIMTTTGKPTEFPDFPYFLKILKAPKSP